MAITKTGPTGSKQPSPIRADLDKYEEDDSGFVDARETVMPAAPIGGPSAARLFEEHPLISNGDTPPFALPPRPTPMKPGIPGEITNLPAITADKAEIAGRYTHLLAQIFPSDELVWNHLGNYLKFAEAADPESAAVVYSKIIKLAEKNFNKMDRHDPAQKEEQRSKQWQIGLSLMRAGYKAEGRNFIDRAMAISPIIFSQVLKEAARLGLDDIVRETLIAYRYALYSAEAAGVDDDYFYSYTGTGEIIRLLSSSGDEEPVILPDDSQKIAHDTMLRRFGNLTDNLYAIVENYRLEYLPERHYKDSVDEVLVPPDFADRHTRNSICDDLIDIQRECMYESDLSNNIRDCLATSSLYRIGLEALARYPQSFAKVMLYKYAACHIPLTFTDDERAALADSYLGALKLQELASSAQGHMQSEDFGLLTVRYSDSSENAWNLPYHLGPYFYKHTEVIAKILLETGDATQRAAGLDMLRDLSSDKSTLLDPSDQPYFVPAINRAFILARNADSFPENEREAILREAYEIIGLVPILSGLRRIHPIATETMRRYGGIIDIALSAAKNGLDTLSGEIIRDYGPLLTDDIENIHSQPGYHPQNKYYPALWNSKVKARASLILPMIESLAAGGSALCDIADRIERDVRGDRHFFSLDAIMEVVRFLSLDTVSQKLSPDSRRARTRMATACIDLFTATTSTDEENLPVLESVVNMIKDMPISSSEKDGLFARLIERMIPETGVKPQNLGMGFVTICRQAAVLTDTVIGNPDYPKSEALIISQFARVAREIEDYKTNGLGFAESHGFSWLFERIASATILDPQNRDALMGLREGEAYATAVENIHALRSMRPSPHIT